MTDRQTQLIEAMTEFDGDDTKRINHFLKVCDYAKMIGRAEHLDEHTQLILETAAIVHDIGIHACEEKYGHTGGKQQEIEGPPLAEEMLKTLGYEEDIIERVSWLVAHHHTYTDVKDIDHQILLEADFLVNSYEDGMKRSEMEEAAEKIFKTDTGKMLIKLQIRAM